MTILQMLKRQCDFQKAAVSDERPVNADLQRVNLPDDFCDFYQETDGGNGSIFFPGNRKPFEFVLYSMKKMQEMKKWFLEYSTMLYEELYLLDERKINEEEQERLHRVSVDLAILGECGNPLWPDYMFIYKDAFFLMSRDRLDFPFHDGGLDEKDVVSRDSFYDFLSKALKSMEPFVEKEDDL